MDNEFKPVNSCHGGTCPQFMARLPMDRKVQVVLGGLIILLAFLGTLVEWSGFNWLLIILGGFVVYAGFSGHCVLTMLMNKYCCHNDKDPDDTF